MPEQDGRIETLQAEPALNIGAVTLLPITRTVRHTHSGPRHRWWRVVKEPYALVLRDADGLRAVDVDAVALPLEELRRTVPGLDAALAAL